MLTHDQSKAILNSTNTNSINRPALILLQLSNGNLAAGNGGGANIINNHTNNNHDNEKAFENEIIRQGNEKNENVESIASSASNESNETNETNETNDTNETNETDQGNTDVNESCDERNAKIRTSFGSDNDVSFEDHYRVNCEDRDYSFTDPDNDGNDELNSDFHLKVTNDYKRASETFRIINNAQTISITDENKSRIKQPINSLVNKLPENIIREIFQYVDQFDLVNLLKCCTQLYPIAIERLYQRVTVILNAQFRCEYRNDHRAFIRDNGIKYMDSALIFDIQDLFSFMRSITENVALLQYIKFFVFDKCHASLQYEIESLQNDIIDFFGEYSNEISFLHITFLEFMSGITKLSNFLRNDNIRNKIFKLFVTSIKDLYTPSIPQGLTNLFLMLDETDLMKVEEFDLSTNPYDTFNSLFTLTCSTNHQYGLQILKNMKLISNDIKLKLKGLTIFHLHKENMLSDELEALFNNLNVNVNKDDELYRYIKSLDKRLNFETINSKIDLTYLNLLYLKIDCCEHRINNCNCFQDFFKNLTIYSKENNGLPNLNCFELELYPNYEWLRPHQILENILTPLGHFIKSLSKLSRLTIDYLTPAFKMFDVSLEMSSNSLNKLNERLMEAFFLCFFVVNDENDTIVNLKTLQLPDFLTSFIYYKPDFYNSLLHTCQCWGCQIVLEKLKELFFPLYDPDEEDDESEDEDWNDNNNRQELDAESSYYILIGFILGKLQSDREVCIPIKQTKFDYKNYPIYKGQPHTLHNHYHEDATDCKCNFLSDPQGMSEYNIDNLVTTYIIHQLKPIINYISLIFINLDNLMIHGIYYEYNYTTRAMEPVFDKDDYPIELYFDKIDEIKQGKTVDLPFGHFRDM